MPAEPPPQWIRDHCAVVGTRIRDRRLWQNRTQEQLAEAAGISWSTVQRIEAGATNTKVGILLAVAAALDADPGELLRRG